MNWLWIAKTTSNPAQPEQKIHLQVRQKGNAETNLCGSCWLLPPNYWDNFWDGFICVFAARKYVQGLFQITAFPSSKKHCFVFLHHLIAKEQQFPEVPTFACTHTAWSFSAKCGTWIWKQAVVDIESRDGEREAGCCWALSDSMLCLRSHPLKCSAFPILSFLGSVGS